MLGHLNLADGIGDRHRFRLALLRAIVPAPTQSPDDEIRHCRRQTERGGIKSRRRGRHHGGGSTVAGRRRGDLSTGAARPGHLQKAA